MAVCRSSLSLRHIYEDDIVTFVGVGNEQGGYDIAKYMFSQFPDDEEINLIIVDGNRTGQTTLDRIAGIERAIAEDERVNLLDSQEGMFSRAQAQEIMENFLVKYDDIDLVICLNDEMAIGAYNAIVASGREDEMLISGFEMCIRDRICTWRMRREPMCGATTTEVYFVASESTRAARRITVSTCRERVCMCWAIFWRSSPES